MEFQSIVCINIYFFIFLTFYLLLGPEPPGMYDYVVCACVHA